MSLFFVSVRLRSVCLSVCLPTVYVLNKTLPLSKWVFVYLEFTNHIVVVKDVCLQSGGFPDCSCCTFSSQQVNQCQERFINQTFNEARRNYCGDKVEPTVNQRKVREKTISCESLFYWPTLEKVFSRCLFKVAVSPFQRILVSSYSFSGFLKSYTACVALCLKSCRQKEVINHNSAHSVQCNCAHSEY